MLAGAALAALTAGSAWADTAVEASTVGELIVTGRSLEETTPRDLARLGHDLAVVSGGAIKD